MGQASDTYSINEPRVEKTNVLVSDLVRHKPGCTATEDGQRLRISDLESRRGLYYLCSENKGAGQLRGHREADLHLCCRICKVLVIPPAFMPRGMNAGGI